MATGINKKLSIVGLMAEVTEGTYLAPAAATNYLQPHDDGFSITPSNALLERKILDSSLGHVSPRLGMKSVAASLGVEFRASGVEGADTNFSLLLQGSMGGTRAISTTTTTKSSGNTGSLLQIQDADIGKFNLGDVICVKQSGAHHVAAVTAKDSTASAAFITISPAKPSGSFSASVVISKSKMFYTSNTGHPNLSVSVYEANEILEKAYGCKVSSMSIDNFSTGQIAGFTFGLEGLGFDQVDGSAPHVPTFDSGLPPIILSATVYQNGVSIDINKFGLNLKNTLHFLTATGNANGKSASRVMSREITGTIDPYKDDTSVANFTNFQAGTEFSLFIRAYNPSSVSGEMTMGSIVGMYLPSCFTTSLKTGNQGGILTDEIAFKATRGPLGASEEMYVGLI